VPLDARFATLGDIDISPPYACLPLDYGLLAVFTGGDNGRSDVYGQVQPPLDNKGKIRAR
jgi:hypothetical protein